MNKCFELNCGGSLLSLGQARVMGVLNVTPDSFYESSRCRGLEYALKRAEKMVEAGVDILDVGGESTSQMVHRYGYENDTNYYAARVAEQKLTTVDACEQELERVVPVVEALVKRFDCIVSVDTSSAMVIKETSRVGVGMINDIRALQRPGALEAVAATDLPVVLMHSLVENPKKGFVPHYNDLVGEITDYLNQAVNRCLSVGIERQRIVIDPGFGGGLFGKTPDYDLSMLKNFSRFHELGLPILAGLSRKSFIGAILDKAPDQRLAGSLAAAIIAVQEGAHIIRVHDVAETCDVIRILAAVKDAD